MLTLSTRAGYEVEKMMRFFGLIGFLVRILVLFFGSSIQYSFNLIRLDFAMVTLDHIYGSF